MKHSKKLLALLLTAALALGMLAGCGEEPAAESAAPPSEEPAAAESEAPASEEPAEEGPPVLTDMAGGDRQGVFHGPDGGDLPLYAGAGQDAGLELRAERP